MLVYGECECFVMQMLYVCVLCATCGTSQCCVLHNLQFVNAGRGCKMRPYGRGILQSWSHNCLIGSHECLLLFTPSCCSLLILPYINEFLSLAKDQHGFIPRHSTTSALLQLTTDIETGGNHLTVQCVWP